MNPSILHPAKSKVEGKAEFFRVAMATDLWTQIY